MTPFDVGRRSRSFLVMKSGQCLAWLILRSGATVTWWGTLAAWWGSMKTAHPRSLNKSEPSGLYRMLSGKPASNTPLVIMANPVRRVCSMALLVVDSFASSTSCTKVIPPSKNGVVTINRTSVPLTVPEHSASQRLTLGTVSSIFMTLHSWCTSSSPCSSLPTTATPSTSRKSLRAVPDFPPSSQVCAKPLYCLHFPSGERRA
mmetsp:Transcript_46727/g.108022  ORF Transcript_46727/g.108022 Transcript_46727/m.108022 type:complete len:203 (-) Transcript_46727:112-720(-)